MTDFTKRVLQIIQGIPPGKVMTYGQVAAVAGSPRGARQVVRVLHSMSAKYGLPWHRIINVQGGISAPDESEGKVNYQRSLLEAESVRFDTAGKVDLTVYRWFPEDAKES
ncbi:MGMT family protein [Sporosarcina limicola]|uniref:Methylated-DNA-protein-cysteine methyltransferase-like protein n=1 Tax=Sporosarcina limicola TaxID=34101 RepID=A0A927R310_9BACL|nr:MGMT family protein [Sporosarcina limicola]MBE1553248.1 methylated-DNA-protein-cysteine methyltransferase-like protein [Sporosarcina limicola]